jgi:hypothetical protein
MIKEDPSQDIRAKRPIRRIWCGGVERVPIETRK